MIFQNPQQDGPWPGTRFHFPRKTMTTPGSGFGENALYTNRFGLVGNSSTTVRFPGSVIPAAKSKIFRSRLAKYNLSWSKLKENCPIFFEKDIHSILELIRQQTHNFFWSYKKKCKKIQKQEISSFFHLNPFNYFWIYSIYIVWMKECQKELLLIQPWSTNNFSGVHRPKICKCWA